MPRPILKPCSQPGPLLPPQLEPHVHVHFPRSDAALERHYAAFGRDEYDRSTIRVAHNICALPERGCPGRTYDLPSASTSRSTRKACKKGRTVHPSSLYSSNNQDQFLDELAFYFDDDHQHQHQYQHHQYPHPPPPPSPPLAPPLMRENSSESSDDSDGHLSTPPELDPRHVQLAMAYHTGAGAGGNGGGSWPPRPFSAPYEPPPIPIAHGHYSVSASYPPSQHDNGHVSGAMAFLPHAPESKKKKTSQRLMARVQLAATTSQSFAPWSMEEGCLGGF